MVPRNLCNSEDHVVVPVAIGPNVAMPDDITLPLVSCQLLLTDILCVKCDKIEQSRATVLRVEFTPCYRDAGTVEKR